ncbi:unnamed protein product [Linum trigynum]
MREQARRIGHRWSSEELPLLKEEATTDEALPPQLAEHDAKAVGEMARKARIEVRRSPCRPSVDPLPKKKKTRGESSTPEKNKKKEGGGKLFHTALELRRATKMRLPTSEKENGGRHLSCWWSPIATLFQPWAKAHS